MTRTNFLLTACLIAAAALWAAIGADAAEDYGPIGTVTQPIVAGDAVSVRRQQQLGLVTVGNDCSGILLTQYWVLTANHCVAANANNWKSADAPYSRVRISAAWTRSTATPTRYVRFWDSKGLDVALIYLGAGDLGPVDRKLIYHNEVDTSVTLTQFGRGRCSFATDTAPAQRECGYRQALFTPSAVDGQSIAFKPNDAGQITNGGDSGGPSFVTDADGNPFAIAGVLSRCPNPVSAIGKGGTGWDWVIDIKECINAPLIEIRDNIHTLIAETPSVPPAAATERDRSKDVELREGDRPAVTKSKSPHIGGN
jgi:hypothetical protein